MGAQPGSTIELYPNTDLSILERRLTNLESAISKLERIFFKIFNKDLTDESDVPETTATVVDESSISCTKPPVPEKLEEMRNVMVPSATAVSNTIERKTIVIKPSTIRKPRYDGRCEYYTAAEFLDCFDHYVRAENLLQTDKDRIEAVNECLQGEPKLWCRAFRYRFDSWKTFERLFLARFWGCQQQRKFMDKLLHGKYVQQGKRCRMAAYFTRLLINAQHLQLPPAEDRLVRMIMGHFPSNVQELLMYSSDIGSAYNILVIMDQKNNKYSELSHNDRSGGGSCNATK